MELETVSWVGIEALVGVEVKAEELLVIICAMLLVAPGGPGDALFWSVAGTTDSCYEVSGEVVRKTEDPPILWVWVELNDTHGQGHKVYVTDSVYDNYEMNETYTETVCDMERYLEIKEFLEYMLDSGISIDFNKGDLYRTV